MPSNLQHYFQPASIARNIHFLNLTILFIAQLALTSRCSYGDAAAIHLYVYLTVRKRYTAFNPFQPAKLRFNDKGFIAYINWLHAKKILSDDINRTSSPGMT